MNARRAVALLLGLILIIGQHQAQGRPAQTQRPEAFIPGIPTVLNTPLSLVGAIAIPGLPLASTDLLWVDQASERLYISDRTNFGVDIINTEHDSYVGRITGFVGPSGPRGAGPNGLLVTPDNKLWAGD